MTREKTAKSERLSRLAADMAVGIGLALLVLSVVLFAGQAAPAFVYEMF
jgi:hypothetical protein